LLGGEKNPKTYLEHSCPRGKKLKEGGGEGFRVADGRDIVPRKKLVISSHS